MESRHEPPSPAAEAGPGGEPRRYMPELESLRGLAMLLVLVFHVDRLLLPVPVPEVSLPYAFVRGGNAGVELFFVLSAFLLALPFLADAAGGPRVVLSHYAARRALRILPAYYAAVVVGTVCTAAALGDLVRGVPYLLFLHGFARMAEPLFPFSATWWSLATEAQFYVLLPLVLCFRTRGGRRPALAALALYGAVYSGLISGRLSMATVAGHLTVQNSVVVRAPVFFAGILAAWIHLRHGERLREGLAASAWVRNGGADVALAVVLLLLGRHLRWIATSPAAIEISPRAIGYVWCGLLFALLLLMVLLAPLRLKPLLSNGLLARLGVVSYSVYLIHVPFMWFALSACGATWTRACGRAPGRVVAAVALALACIALSAVTYRLVERPFLGRKPRLLAARLA